MKKFTLKKWYPRLPEWVEIGAVARYSKRHECYFIAKYYSIQVSEVENNPDFWELIEEEKRGLSSDSLIGRTATVKTGFYEYRTGVVTHVREAETEIDLGNGISGTESYPVVTIVDKHGKEHIGQLPKWRWNYKTKNN